MKKYIFFHNPKCGGTTIHHLLPNHHDELDWRWHNLKAPYSWADMSKQQKEKSNSLSYASKPHHYTPTQHMEMEFFSKNEMQNAFKFTFIRNPFDKLVSEYYNSGKRSSFEKYVHISREIVEKDMYFLDAIIANDKHDGSDHIQANHLVPQYMYVYDKDGNQAVDYVGRMESYQDSVEEVLSYLELEIPDQLVRVGSSKDRKIYQEYYTQELVNIVEVMYEKDLNLFNYEF